jgi:CHAT domain-containing protein
LCSHVGCAFRRLGKIGEARDHFEQALAFERLEPFFTYTSYWQALSARELGDSILQQAGEPPSAPNSPQDAVVILDYPEKLRPALDAYHDGRLFLNAHLTVQCRFPLSRGAKQQIFRSFSKNAIQAAAFLQGRSDLLAEAEWSGPREATEVVTEIAAARETAPTELAAFRRNRALYIGCSTTLPAQFEDYLAHISIRSSAARGYLAQSFALDNRLVAEQGRDNIAELALNLRVPDAVFLLFHVGVRASMLVLTDVSAGLVAPFPLEFGEDTLRTINKEYAEALAAATEENQKKDALDRLLLRYEDLLGPVLDPILRVLPTKHLKIFPRLQMNSVPLHALRFQGKCLIEHSATISYGQTLGLFLENHSNQSDSQKAALRMVMGDGVPWYELLLPKISQSYGPAFSPERATGWLQLITSLSANPARDTVFACHGKFDPADVESSYLQLRNGTSDGMVSFHQVFGELDLRGCRSVMMGACESGLARANISAEYIGLPRAMLSSGMRYVAGALWTIPRVATALIVDRYLELLKDEGNNVCAALCTVQREVMRIARDEVSIWIRKIGEINPESKESLNKLAQQMSTKELNPYSHPYFWAGMEIVGDL